MVSPLWYTPLGYLTTVGISMLSYAFTSKRRYYNTIRLFNLNQQTRCSINVDLTLVQRRRRWINVKPTLIQHLVSAGERP